MSTHVDHYGIQMPENSATTSLGRFERHLTSVDRGSAVQRRRPPASHRTKSQPPA
jgi:hypothetical protein